MSAGPESTAARASPARERPRRGRRAGKRAAAALALLLALAAASARAADEADVSRPNPAQPTRVQVALYLVDLHDVIGADQAFVADVALRAQWQDPRLAGQTGMRGLALADVWHPRLQLANQRAATATLPQRIEVDGGGRVTYRQLYSGRFTSRMNFTDFPLDRHRLRVQLVAVGYSPSEIELVPAESGLRSGSATSLSVTDWEMGPATMSRADYERPGEAPLSGVELSWNARRNLAFPAVQVILPLVLIVLMGWTALWPDPVAAPPRISIAVTTMLTLIAYRFTLARSLPSLAYLTRMDYFILGCTVLVFLILVLVTLSSRLQAQGRKDLVARLDRWGAIVYPLAFATIFALAWWA